MAILDAVERKPMGASELARHLGLSVPTAHRLVGAMVQHGLLRRDSEGRHRPGTRFDTSALTGAARPVLEQLCRETSETAQLWMRRGDDRICLLTVDSQEELRATVPVWTRLPLARGGSAALALQAGETVDAGGQPWMPGRWYESLAHRIPGLGSVSAPVFHHGALVAAVCLAAPLARVGDDGPGAIYGDKVVEAATRIERVLDAE
ncbi:MarR family transcriptional regulator [Streptomyces antnestii]|uniref:MarR family transcriptional regulator n=2 Tax=Streptomyces TaxID=1883 RepID=A0A3S2WIA8_9ACTN|nr:MarR family transcriptional regulator [Streptomyces sp. San01]